MKKLTKNTLAQMAALLPELDEEDQRRILGGTATTTIPPDYTGSVPLATSAVSGCYDVTGYYSSSTTEPIGVSQALTGAFTFDEMDQMIDNGTWTGGYVDGIGYIGEATYVTGYYQVATGAIIPDSLDSSRGQNAEEDLPWYQDLLMSTGGGYCRFMNQDEIQTFQETVEVNAELSVSSGIGVSSPFF